MTERVADYIIRRIQQAGAAYVFLVTGRGILQLTDAVAKNPHIQGIPTYHEQGASYAAMAYAKATGGIGACLVSTGCAAANAITACLCAWQDNLPVVFLSGQHSLKETTRYTGVPIRTYGSQEADIIGLVEPITKYAVMLTETSRTAYEVEKALYLAQEGRKGPVWIDVPLDVQGMRMDADSQEHFQAEAETEMHQDMDAIIRELSRAKRPLLVIGGGCRDAKESAESFVLKTGIPAVYTFSACDVYGSGNRLSIGAIGSIGAPRAGNFTLQNADYVLVVGSKMCSQSIGNAPERIAGDAKIAVVDIDPKEHRKAGIRIDCFIRKDASEFFNLMTPKIGRLDIGSWRDKCLHWKDIFSIEKEAFVQELDEENRVDLYRLASELSIRLRDGTVVVTDAGLEELIIPSTISYRKKQKCFFVASQGAMGYAIPAVLGAYFGGCKDIITVVGDGSIMMNLQELQILKFHNIPARIIVVNNNMYSVIRSRQKDLFRTRTIGNDPSDGVPAPDLKALAGAFGFDYCIIRDNDALAKGLDRIMKMNAPVLCEVCCKKDQKYFHTSYRRNQAGKVVRLSIEDQSPFMDRELLMREMITELKDL